MNFDHTKIKSQLPNFPKDHLRRRIDQIEAKSEKSDRDKEVLKDLKAELEKRP